ncbi:MAG: type II secretion system protein [Clostridia bacterium]
MTKEKQNSKGITLIALVVTIVVLLILAGITITAAIGNNGLITRAKTAAEKTNQAVQNDISEMEEYDQELKDLLDEMKPISIESLMKKVATKNETVYDKYGNKITVPKGFKIVTPAEDSTVVYAYDKENETSTNIPVVQDGIVIQDSAGNQFVWIPVGEIKNDATENTTNKTTIILGRYTFNTGSYDWDNEVLTGTGKETLKQAAYTDENATNYTNTVKIGYFQEDSTPREGLVDDSDHLNDLNATAKDLASFVNSVKTKGGYYIARYEASYGSGYNSSGTTDALKYANAKPLSKPSTANSEDSMDYTPGTLWNYITQLNAAKVARNMYAGNKDINNNEVGVESDLINSYAWDTAIVFIQKYSSNTAYSIQNSKNTGSLANTGERPGTTDKVCNIYDMASNITEWTTEYSTYTYNGYARSCGSRGGEYSDRSNTWTERRGNYYADDSNNGRTFRLTLYIK